MNKFYKIFIFISLLIFNSKYISANQNQIIWSILICTLKEREVSFNRLFDKLSYQIKQLNLQNQIEILYFKDNRNYKVGYKRNRLLEQSKGTYICYIDDDDDIDHEYIKIIYEKLQRNPDCVSLAGILTTNNQNPRLFVHSIKYHSWFEKKGVYFRPPNHLNPIKRDIAIKFRFPEINNGEDYVWSINIAKSGLLKKEETISKPYYFYKK